jgi:6-phosphofructokinase 1
MTPTKPTLAIVCGGGPAPGINSVIASATIEGINSGYRVLGIEDGFRHLIHGSTDHVRELSIGDVSRIHLEGGSVLRIARTSLTRREEGAADPEWRMNQTLAALRKLRVEGLITIGGDGTAFVATRLAQKADGDIIVAHVPKTIDNDLPLPGGMPTFGFESARHFGVEVVNNLMVEAITTHRWFFVVAMGRSAGHLAVGITKSSGATVAVIAEEFPGREAVPLQQVVDILETAMIKRMVLGRPFGVAILSEGISLRIPEEDLARFDEDLERDSYGKLRLSEIHLHRILTRLVKERFRARGQPVTIVAKSIGYELRCAEPIPFDIDYTRDLGFGAVEYLRRIRHSRHHEIGAMIAIHEGDLSPVPLGSFLDSSTGFTRVRQVNTHSESYRVARRYMIRLERSDFDNADLLKNMAEIAQQTPQDFEQRYGYLVGL